MAADTIRFIVTVAIVVYKGLIPVVGRMLTEQQTIGKTVRKKKPERASGLGGLKQKTYLWT